MNELLCALNAAEVRYLLIGGQAMRLFGMPRFSMDWDLFIPARDEANFSKLNEVLAEDLDSPVVALGPQGENVFRENLLAAKRAADRPQDQADIAFLEELKRLGKLP